MAIGDNPGGFGPGGGPIGGMPDRIRDLSARRPIDPNEPRGLPEFKRSARRGGQDPYDLKGAFNRLAQLLRLDGGGGPRADAPDRGYYLNILV